MCRRGLLANVSAGVSVTTECLSGRNSSYILRPFGHDLDSPVPILAHFNGEKGMSDREGHVHKAVVYKSHFPPLRHSVVTETPADTLANKPRLHTNTPFVLYAPTTPLTRKMP